MVDRAGSFRAGRAGLALAGVAAAPIAFRLALLQDRIGTLAWPDARGLSSDLVVSLAALALLIAVARYSRIAAGLLALIWATGHAVNYESVAELAAMASVLDLHYFGDATFVMGSGLSTGRPILAGVLVAITLALARWGLRLERVAVAASAGAALAMGAALSAWPWADDAAGWRQTDFVAYNAGQLLSGAAAGGEGGDFPSSAAAMLDLMPDLAANLDGELRAPLDLERRNVLVVVLESVSAGFLKSLASDHGRRPSLSMPRLDGVARRHLSFSSFFVHQRRTNRGLYTIICGELPSFGREVAKMSRFVEGERECLPKILERAGYLTAYGQAAPLAFMLKDQFMPRAGFEQMYGRDHFERGYAESYWGVDDRAFLEQSSELIEKLERQEKPWFLTLLTVGTHHPYIVPPTFQPGASDRRRAIHYLDLAFSEFMSRLNQSGVLENTLLIVTSDESRGSDSDDAFTQNWGFLVVRSPEGLKGRVRKPFGLMDLAISVLDYVGLGDRGGHLFGRSVFRDYPTGRFLFFANSNLHFAGLVDPGGYLIQCQRDFAACRKQKPKSGRVFAKRMARSAIDPSEIELVREMAARSVYATAASSPTRVFPLMANPLYRVESKSVQVVYGFESLDMTAGQWVEFEVEVEATGDSGRVEFIHDFRNYEKRQLFDHRKTISAGETFRFNLTFTPHGKRGAFEATVLARLLDGDHLDLAFEKARVTLHRSGEPPERGVRVVRDEVGPSD